MTNRRASYAIFLTMFALAVFAGGCSSEAPKEGVKPHKDSYTTYPGQRPPAAAGSKTGTPAP